MGQIRLEPPKGSADGSIKVSQRLRKFRFSSGLLGQIRFGVRKGSVEGAPIPSLILSPSSFLTSFLHFSSTELALGSSAIVKVLGQNDMFVFLGSLQQMVFASQKVLWSVPHPVLYIDLRKGFVEGSANYSLRF